MRRLLTLAGTMLAAAVVLVAWNGEMPRAEAIDYVAGDVDCSGEVEAVDAVGALTAMSGLAGEDACAPWAGDVDCDGATDDIDALRILQDLAGVASATVSGGSCPAIGSNSVTPPSSFELIEAAVTAGDITPQDGIVYKVLAAFGDPALPPEYEGYNLESVDATLFTEAAALWDTLSPQQQETINPYMLVPTDPESWVEADDIGAAAIEWDTVENEDIKVWWQTRRPEDEAKAQAILREMETNIWDVLIDYMDLNEPLSDEAMLNNGGDGRFDIYLLHIPSLAKDTLPPLGYVKPHTKVDGGYDCELTPGWMAMNSTYAATPSFYSTVAHEFMHAIQFTYDVGDCQEYKWLMEATATWSENYVYPPVNDEHTYGTAFLDKPRVSLEFYEYADLRQYGAYLFFFFLEKQYGMEFAVRDVWRASGNADSLAAIESVITGRGGFDDVWPEFALYTMNTEPYDEFRQWDKVPLGVKRVEEILDLVNNQETVYTAPTDLAHLSQEQYHYFVSANVHSITITNPYAEHFDDEVTVQALIMKDGQWTRPPEDWTADGEKFFCLDKDEEDIDELAIVVTNNDHEDRNHTLSGGPITIKASPLGCEGWVGTAQAEIVYFDARFNVTVEGVLFEPPEDETEPTDRYVTYDLARASVTWHASGIWPGGCPLFGSMQLAAPQSGEDHEATGHFQVDREENDYAVFGAGHNFDAELYAQCPGDDPLQLVFPVLSWIWDGGNVQHLIEVENGVAHARGSYFDPSETYGGTWTWDFTEVK